MPEHDLFRNFVSRMNKLSIDEIDFEMLEAQISERSLGKHWQAAKDYKI